MIKAYGTEYFLSLAFILILTVFSILLLKNKKVVYKNFLLNFLAFFMLLVNLFFVVAKYNWKNLNTHVLLTTLSIAISLSLATTIFAIEKNNKIKLVKVLKATFAILIMLSQVALMIVQGVQGVDIYFFAHLCNQMSWLLASCILIFPKSKVVHYAYYGALAGAFISLAYPATFKDTTTIFHFDFFRNVFGHGAMLWATLFMWQTNIFTPKLNKVWYLPLGLSISYSYAYIANLISINVFNSKSNYLFLNSFPVPYLNSYIAAIIGVAIIYLIVYIVEKTNKQKTT